MITLFTGPNTYTIAQAIRRRADAFDGEVETFDASEIESRQLPDLFTGTTLFSSQRLVVLRGVSNNKTLWTDLEQWIERVPEETEILMVESNPDKRTKTFKQLQKFASVTEHKELQDVDLISWLQSYAQESGVDLSSEIAKYLISYVGHDQWRLSSEFDKLILSNKPLSRELIQDLAEPYPEATAFELLDALFSNNPGRVYELLSLLREREDPYQFFGLLSSQVVALYALTCSGERRPEEIAKDMALHPFVLQKLRSTANRLGKKAVEKLIERLAHADTRIKTSGVDPWRQLEITLLGTAT